jgi:hypothetical protein
MLLQILQNTGGTVKYSDIKELDDDLLTPAAHRGSRYIFIYSFSDKNHKQSIRRAGNAPGNEIGDDLIKALASACASRAPLALSSQLWNLDAPLIACRLELLCDCSSE